MSFENPERRSKKCQSEWPLRNFWNYETKHCICAATISTFAVTKATQIEKFWNCEQNHCNLLRAANFFGVANKNTRFCSALKLRDKSQWWQWWQWWHVVKRADSGDRHESVGSGTMVLAVTGEAQKPRFHFHCHLPTCTAVTNCYHSPATRTHTHTHTHTSRTHTHITYTWMNI
jgi:hypothetical protein